MMYFEEADENILQEAMLNFEGKAHEIEKAIGMYMMAFFCGYQVLYIIHSKRAVAKSEKILNIKFSNKFGKLGEHHDKSLGLEFANKQSNFWKVVSGEIPNTKKMEFKKLNEMKKRSYMKNLEFKSRQMWLKFECAEHDALLVVAESIKKPKNMV